MSDTLIVLHTALSIIAIVSLILVVRVDPPLAPGFWPRPRPAQRKSLTVRCSGNRSRCSSLCSGEIFAFAPVRKAS